MAVEQALLALIGAADVGGAYRISRSLRFNSADSAYLSRTPGSAGNRRTFTFACWVKRVKDDASPVNIFAAGANNFRIAFGVGTTAYLQVYDYNGSSFNFNKGSAASYRDFSAWYHIVVAIDTTNATADDRVKMYVNGSRITDLYTGTNINPSQNLDTYVNSTSNAHYIGYLGSSGLYLDAYLADVHFIDGQALDPSSFTETSATTGQLIPKAYTGSYGTNGFRLPFSDNSGTTSTTLGKDAAGSNNWTPNNFSVASGSGNDSLTDSPTSYGTDTGVGGEVRGNYCTVNPLNVGSAVTLANGNLDASVASSGNQRFWGTIGVSTGKWYFEYTQTSGTYAQGVGIKSTFAADNNNNYFYYGYAGDKVNASGSGSAYGATWGNNDVVGVAFDLDAGTITFYKNGTSQGQAFSGLPSATYFPYGIGWAGGTWAATMNFGQRPFAYTAPSGYKALCDTNLTAPTIAKPADYFDVKLYTGNSSTQTISGLGFSPDLVWLKCRSDAYSHRLFDQVRGTTKVLYSNLTAVEDTISGVTAFNSDGFTLGSETGGNISGQTFVAWAWDAASSNSTNTSGTITSTVRANATAGFSIVTYTADSSTSSTVGHGLNAAPKFLIYKLRNATSNWEVRTTVIDGSHDYLFLNTTDAKADSGLAAPTSTVFTNIYGTNNTVVVYAFAPVTNYSAFGSYTGNGSSDGPFVFTGFRPRWIMTKNTSTASDWWMHDTARNTYNVIDLGLLANQSSSESGSGFPYNSIDVLSNGFKIRNNSSGQNGSTNVIVYAAFAESPFQYARAR